MAHWKGNSANAGKPVFVVRPHEPKFLGPAREVQRNCTHSPGSLSALWPPCRTFAPHSVDKFGFRAPFRCRCAANSFPRYAVRLLQLRSWSRVHWRKHSRCKLLYVFCVESAARGQRRRTFDLLLRMCCGLRSSFACLPRT